MLRVSSDRVRGVVAGICGLAWLLSCASKGEAGPWVSPQGGYAKLWLKWLPGIGYYTGKPERAAIPYGAYHELFVSTYLEGTLIPSLAVTLHFPMLQNFWLEDPRTKGMTYHATPGDPTLGLRWAFFQRGRAALALEASVKAPLARGGPVQPVFSTDRLDKFADLRLGTGVWDIYAALSGGYAWRRLYAAASVGWLYRTGGFDSVLRWSAEGGWQITWHWALRVRLQGWHPLGGGTAPYTESPSGLGNGTAYTGFALEGEFRLAKHWTIGLSLEGGLIGVVRQSGGPVISPYVAIQF